MAGLSIMPEMQPPWQARDGLRITGALLELGYRNLRLQTGAPGRGHYGAPPSPGSHPGTPHPGGWDVHSYLRTVPRLFAAARDALGEAPSLMHDVHSRPTVKQAIALVRELETYKLAFLEDPIPPEHYDRLPEIRSASPLPIAVGEQLSSVADAARLITHGGADILRLHLSAIGGVTPARKLVALCELLGVGTAWHGPADVSPVGQAANIALDVTTPAFAIQEGHLYPDAVHEVFPGTLCPRNGYVYPAPEPGWGIDINETLTSKYPPRTGVHERWAAQARSPDGGLFAP